ncbi:MAG: SpoVG family protein [Candidatus Omnitrophota bacterium]
MSKQDALKVEHIRELKEAGSLKAFCDLLIVDTFVVKGLRIFQGKEGLFVSMPQQQGRDGKWYDTFYPVSADVRKDIQKRVLSEYSEYKNKNNDIGK